MSDLQMKTIRNMLRESGGSKGMTIAQRRESMASMTEVLPIPANTEISKVDGAVQGEWVTTGKTNPQRTILYLHGGAYIAGAPKTHRSLVAALCNSCQSRAFVAQYRLAPEHPYPAAVEDAVAAYKWLLESPEMAVFGEDAAKHITVAGDSAGGALSLAMLVSAREQGLPMPAAAVCMSPWADLSCSGVGYSTRAESDPITDGDNISDLAKIYLNGEDPKSPLASPAFADLSGLPPLLIQVGSDEVLMGDSLLVEARAHDCGTKATLEIWAGMVHVWHAFYPMLSEGQDAIDRIGSFLDSHWSESH